MRNTWGGTLRAVMMTVGLAGCGGGSGGSSSGTGPPPPPAATPTYRITLNPLNGTETNLRAVAWVGPRAVTRSDAGNAAALRAAGFSSTTLETDGTGGTVSRTVGAQRGQTVTIIALEPEGVYSNTQFPSLPAPLNNVTEFATFTGSVTVQNSRGVGSFVAGDANVDVTVNFRRMPQVGISVIGATGIDFDFQIPPVLDTPERANPNSRAFSGSSVIMAPARRVYATMQFPTGSMVTLRARPGGEFLRWEGACSGTGLSCRLRFGDQSGDQATALITAFMACERGGPTQYSGFVPGAPIPRECAIITP